VIVRVRPATVSVPLRIVGYGLASRLNPTTALPVPLAGPVIVTQVTLLVAVHAQVVPVAVTVTVPLMAPEANDWAAGEIE
jgi:hypothetical protein